MGRWDSSTRRSRLPGDWAKRRQRILKRDEGRCTWVVFVEGAKVRCSAAATEVDHHIPGDDHSDENLRSLCSDHHAIKTSREGHAARSKNLSEAKKRFRRIEEHPALKAGAPNGFIPRWEQYRAGS